MTERKPSRGAASHLSLRDLDLVRGGGSPLFQEGGARTYVSRTISTSGEDPDAARLTARPVPPA